MHSSISSRFIAEIGLTVVAFATLVLPAITFADSLTRQLQIGMSGSDVSTLQSFLANDATIYPQGLVTGYFGSMTKSAVRNFQARNGIATVGRVGPQTMGVINSQMNGGATVGTHRQSPTIGFVSISTSATMATMSWNTDEPASALVYYSTSPLAFSESDGVTGVTIYGATSIANINMQSSHTATLPNLQANTTYNYIVYVRDSSGNESVTWPATFRTTN